MDATQLFLCVNRDDFFAVDVRRKHALERKWKMRLSFVIKSLRSTFVRVAMIFTPLLIIAFSNVSRAQNDDNSISLDANFLGPSLSYGEPMTLTVTKTDDGLSISDGRLEFDLSVKQARLFSRYINSDLNNHDDFLDSPRRLVRVRSGGYAIEIHSVFVGGFPGGDPCIWLSLEVDDRMHEDDVVLGVDQANQLVFFVNK